MEDIDKPIKIEHEEDDDDAGKQQPKEPPRTVTRNIRGGQLREYNFLESVNSMEELENLRFKVISKQRECVPFLSLNKLFWNLFFFC
jgi:hypothetical protein